MRDLGGPSGINAVKPALCAHLAANLGLSLRPGVG